MMPWTRYVLGPEKFAFVQPDTSIKQKRSACSWLLLQEFVKIRQEQEKERINSMLAGEILADMEDLPMPSIPYVRIILSFII